MDPALALTLRFRLRRERDHDAVRRAAEALCTEVVRRGGVIGGWGDVVAPALHPALPALQCHPEGDALVGHACGWPAGPGFHEAALGALEAVAEESGVDLTVDDPTGYATSRDRAALEGRYAAVLADAARAALDFLDREGERAHVQLGLPPPGDLEHLRLAGDPPGIYTPEGRRERPWLEALASGASPPSTFYPWWSTALDAVAERRLGRSLVETRLTWQPAKTDRQRHLRKLALEALRRGSDGAPEETAAIHQQLELLAAGEGAKRSLGLRGAPRVVRLAGGFAAVVPGHYEVVTSDGMNPPPGVEAGLVYVDVHTRFESLAQTAPEGVPLLERIENLFAQPAAEQALLRIEPKAGDAGEEEPRFAGYAIERALEGGGTALIGSLVGERTHLVARIVTATGGDPTLARGIFLGIAPERPSPIALFL